MKESYEKMLQSSIVTSLGGPGGDPDNSHCEAAAYAAAILLDAGCKVDKDSLSYLTKENIYEFDFLKEAQQELSKLKEKHKD